jgi:hypothetical protein
MKTEKSKALELLRFVWDNEKTRSCARVNSLMQDALKVAIGAQLKFDKDDFKEILMSLSGGYWLGTNTNDNGMGEIFYRLACETGNISFAQSYESFYDFKPFLTSKGNRLYKHSRMKYNERRYRVTGFDFEKKKIHLVSYELSDYKEEGKRQLHCFDNKEWNNVRKEYEEF